MDIYVIMQVIILFGAIFLGVRLGGMGIGYAGGLGFSVVKPWHGMFLRADSLGCNPHHHVCYRCHLCFTVRLAVLIIWCVLQKGILRKNPKHINYLAPTVTYFLTLLAGTGHTASP